MSSSPLLAWCNFSHTQRQTRGLHAVGPLALEKLAMGKAQPPQNECHFLAAYDMSAGSPQLKTRASSDHQDPSLISRHNVPEPGKRGRWVCGGFPCVSGLWLQVVRQHLAIHQGGHRASLLPWRERAVKESSHRSASSCEHNSSDSCGDA